MTRYDNLTKAELIERLEQFEATLARETENTPPTKNALQDTEERLAASLRTAVEGIIVIDEHGIIESVNPAAEQIFGWQAAELKGKNVSVLMPSPHRHQHDGYIQNY